MSPDSVAEDESRAEATHLVFFDDNVVGAEYTRDANVATLNTKELSLGPTRKSLPRLREM